MALDIFSLQLLNLLITSCLALCLHVVADRQRPDGLRDWAWALTAFVGVPLLFALQGHISDMLAVVLPNALMSAAFAFALQGLHQFQRRPLPLLWIWLPLPLSLLLSAALIPLPGLRAVAISALLFAQLLHFSRLFQTHWSHTPGRGKYLFAGGMALFLLALSLRATNALQAGPAIEPLTATGELQTLVICLLSMALVLSSVGAALMTKERADARNHELAFIDELTQLPNRRAIEQQLRQLLALARRQQQPLALLVLDIDHFKRINDQHGHLSGDKVLRDFADCLANGLRTQDLAGRWGGEEFVVLLPATSAVGAAVVAERLRALVAHQDFRTLAQQPLQLTTSIGLHPVALNSLEEPSALLDAADRALYLAKQHGRNRVESSVGIFDSGL